MQIRKRQIEGLFDKLQLEVRSTKHCYGWFTFKGKKILRLHYSHGKGNIPGRVSDKIRSQLKLSQNDFKKLIDCPLTMDDYVSILKKKDLID